jgi:hypothetical protein
MQTLGLVSMFWLPLLLSLIPLAHNSSPLHLQPHRHRDLSAWITNLRSAHRTPMLCMISLGQHPNDMLSISTSAATYSRSPISGRATTSIRPSTCWRVRRFLHTVSRAPFAFVSLENVHPRSPERTERPNSGRSSLSTQCISRPSQIS